MNAIRTANTVVATIVLLASAASPFQLARADASILKSSKLGELDSWYGRAGGTVGAERIQSFYAARLPPANVATSYDKDVAERTHMGRSDVAAQPISISYDKSVAERTNMSRGEAAATSVVAR